MKGILDVPTHEWMARSECTKGSKSRTLRVRYFTGCSPVEASQETVSLHMIQPDVVKMLDFLHDMKNVQQIADGEGWRIVGVTSGVDGAGVEFVLERELSQRDLLFVQLDDAKTLVNKIQSQINDIDDEEHRAKIDAHKAEIRDWKARVGGGRS